MIHILLTEIFCTILIHTFAGHVEKNFYCHFLQNVLPLASYQLVRGQQQLQNLQNAKFVAQNFERANTAKHLSLLLMKVLQVTLSQSFLVK